MNPKLTDAQRQALKGHRPGTPIRIVDGKKVYLLIVQDDLPTLWDDYVRTEIERGLQQIDRGEIEDWEVGSIKKEGRRKLRKSHSKAS